MADLHAAGKTVMVQPYVEAVDHGRRSWRCTTWAGVLACGSQGSDAGRGWRARRTGLFSRSGSAPPGLAADELEVAETPSARFPFGSEELLYARVDLLPGPAVLEIELTEPSLFIGYDPDASGRFADAITAASQRRRIKAENGPMASQ